MRISDWSSDVCSSDLCLLSIGLLLNRNRTAITLGVVAEVLIQSPTANRAGHPVSKPSRIAHSLHHLEGAGSLRRFKEIRSEEHTSELQSLMRISYAVFCLKKKTNRAIIIQTRHKK